MNSPSVLVKRRYHKSRPKTKRNKICAAPDSKDLKVKQEKLPKITEKRLTNKFSGYRYFKGAVLTSPKRRGSKGQFLEKLKQGGSQFPAETKKRDMTDYDLFCLLKATKERKLAAVHQSPSIQSSDEDGSFDVSNSFSEEKSKRGKYFKTKFVSHVQEDLRISPRISPEKNMTVSGDTSNGNSHNMHKIEKDKSLRNMDDIDIVARDLDGRTSLMGKSFESSHMSGNSTSKNKTRGSLSKYHKFAVGIADSLLSEKKKCHPSNSWYAEIKSELVTVFDKNHNKPQQPVALDSPISSVKELSSTKENWVKNKLNVTTGNVQEESNEYGGKSKHSFTQDLSREPLDKKSQQQLSEERCFKERKTETWVRAVQENTLHRNIQNDSATQTSAVAVKKSTEKEFLKKVNSASRLSKNTEKILGHDSRAKVLTAYNRTLDNERYVSSYSPYMPQSKICADTVGDLNTLAMRGQVFDPTSCFVSIDNRDNKSVSFWGSKEQGLDLQYQNRPSSRKESMDFASSFVSNQNCKKTQSWISWLTKKDDKSFLGRDSSECLSPTSCLMFHPPVSKRSCVRPEDFSFQTSEPKHLHGCGTTGGLKMWRQFTKQPDMPLKDHHGFKTHFPSEIFFHGNTVAKDVYVSERLYKPACFNFSPK